MIDKLGVVKDTLGFLGPVTTAVPWIREFLVRRRRDQVVGIHVEKPLDRVKEEISYEIESWIAKAKPSDFALVILGLMMLAASFAISLWQEIITSACKPN
jgi:hypothetical protein